MPIMSYKFCLVWGLWRRVKLPPIFTYLFVLSQGPGVALMQDVQRHIPDRAGLPEAALLHRPRRAHVPTHPELPPQQGAHAARRLQPLRSAALRGALLRAEP